MTSPLTKIRLSTWRDVKVYVGRGAGTRCREWANLDKWDRSAGVIEIEVPENAYSVNSSFFLGMFGPSVRALGETAFRAKYLFRGKNITGTVDDGIRYALSYESPLESASTG